jgi:hypothetical protein
MMRLLTRLAKVETLLSVSIKALSCNPEACVTSRPMSLQLCAAVWKVIVGLFATLEVIVAMFAVDGGGQTVAGRVPGLQAPLTRVPDGGREAKALDSMRIQPEQALFGMVKLPV